MTSTRTSTGTSTGTSTQSNTGTSTGTSTVTIGQELVQIQSTVTSAAVIVMVESAGE